MHKRVQWWQQDMSPAILTEGRCEAFISALDDPGEDHSPGRSSCAWIIKRCGGDGEIVHSDAKVSHSSESDEQRGFVAAALGVIASFAGRCSVLIHTNNQHVVDALNGGALKWRKNGWCGSQKQPIKSAELWALILELQERRDIIASGEKESRPSIPEIELAHQMAIKALNG
jgi:ribonuclease HI